MSADPTAEVMCMGVNKGAQRFFVKPVVDDDLKDIYEFCEWWKRNKDNNTAPQINRSCQENQRIVDNHNGNVSLFGSENIDGDSTTGKNLVIRDYNILIRSLAVNV